jgi:hypothetical protein
MCRSASCESHPVMHPHTQQTVAWWPQRTACMSLRPLQKSDIVLAAMATQPQIASAHTANASWMGFQALSARCCSAYVTVTDTDSDVHSFSMQARKRAVWCACCCCCCCCCSPLSVNQRDVGAHVGAHGDGDGGHHRGEESSEHRADWW